MRSRLPVLIVIVSLFAFEPCAAQLAGSSPLSTISVADTSATARPSSASSKPLALRALSTNIMSVWAGGSVSNGHLIGNLRRVRIRMIGIRYHRLLAPSLSEAKSNATLTYTVDVFPLLFLSIPPNTASVPPEGGDLGGEAEAPLYKHGLDTYGFGASPAGLRLTFRSTKRVQPFIAGSTGLAYFVRSVPNDWGKHLNFMFDAGAGIRVILTPDLILTVGYRYHHLSNGFRGQINPGLDANLLHLGISISH